MSVDLDVNDDSRNPSPTSHPENNHTRKVSIIENHFHDKGRDNHAFDSPAKTRKISAQSELAEIGPVRKKSILHMAANVLDERPEKTRLDNGDSNRVKKHSTTDSIHSKTSAYSKSSAYSRARRYSEISEDDRSWWYSFCLKCRSHESHPSWQPRFWPKMCPYPFCPTYRQFSRIIALTLIGILAWCVLYAIVGDTAAPPNGILYQLILLSICAHFGGWLMTLTTLPALIGMLFTGVLFQNVGIVNINEEFQEINKELRHLALVILLIRAGLDLDPEAMKKLKLTVIKIGLIPWVVEAGITAVLSKFFLKIPWDYSILLGSIVAAVSPAVVVSCLFRLRAKGYGVAKGIPTLILAVSSIDDATSVAIFGIVKSIMFSDSSLAQLILQGPVSILGGIAFGVLWGTICNYTPEKHDPFMVPLRILLLLSGGTVAVFGSELIGYGGAGPLACVAAAFTCLVVWTKQGWEIEDNPAATAFEIFWMIFEPILFGITGAQVKFSELDGTIVAIGFGILVAAVLVRMVVTVLVGIGCGYNMKEKVFIAFALMAKATVQAALGPVTLGLISDTSSEEYQHATKIMMVCVLSIMVTAPTGAILITISGPRLLTKTKMVTIPEGWRRSHRPSIRDISIIDEEEEERDVTVSGTATPVSGGVNHRMASGNKNKVEDLTRIEN
ncbi:sodium/hydrogen exchanger 9B2-like [Anthonomus grandis grandis]|uniref:sodium/hydrogen exchanger 9B2-like n=1 Tax=Anthonomus grandis grandis TaxID=2921223 RepID=UPI0021661AA6|nr:sodium/hydrogen exchanger 9B2-like [Anthonomus grandis grandis]XP_050307246.1 sodium/hydrogen exchanger 9B2-like [Anthonomus grandis grandis]XP_050307247.1 sodium/hydrogen exchanger 9B2-like [Anthonomus grandis grandis]XP_050307249.1 sodium/hydrogen exchanger 9B2-like [Anthonomus grandis grandis]